MNPSQLDESLLTAYLDNELSVEERELVEEQLKVNEHWKHLLKELQSVQSLVRELPTPLLARSLAEGPWTKLEQTNATLGITEAKADPAIHPSFSNAILALAAGLFLCGVGSFAWMRFGNERIQIARLEQKANPEDLSASSRIVDMDAAKSPTIDAPEEARLKEAETTLEPSSNLNRRSSQLSAASESDMQAQVLQVQETGKRKLQSMTPMPSAKAEMSDAVVFDLSAGASPMIALNATPSSESPEPVETLIAVRSRTFQKKMLAGKADEGMDTDKKEAIARKDDSIAPPASESSSLSFQAPQAKRLESLSSLELAPQEQHELRVLRSDLPSVAQRLRELGWEFQGDGVLVENNSIVASSERRLGDATSNQDNAATPRPPMLTGAIVEPTDWIRILFEGG